LVAGIAVGLRRNWPTYFVESKIQGTDILVRVEVGDLFEKEGDLLVGSSSTFDTNIEDGTISAKSVQGQYTTRFQKTEGELDRQIVESLRLIAPIGKRLKLEKSYGKSNFYALGTIAAVCCSGRHAYFAAIAHFNAHRVVGVNHQELLDAFANLWNQIRERGSFMPIVSPILGSGYSRVSLTRQNLIMEIVKSFVAASSEGKFAESLTIMIRPEDFQDGLISLDELGLFLKHTCRYVGQSGGSGKSTSVAV
jgi:Domain of unknown function (DUF6430)